MQQYQYWVSRSQPGRLSAFPCTSCIQNRMMRSRGCQLESATSRPPSNLIPPEFLTINILFNYTPSGCYIPSRWCANQGFLPTFRVSSPCTVPNKGKKLAYKVKIYKFYIPNCPGNSNNVQAMGQYDSTLGALGIGYVIATALFGITSVQSFNYFQTFEKDSKYIKATVGGLWVLDTLQLILIGHAVYFWSVTNYGNPSSLIYSTTSFHVGVLVTHTIVFVIELVLAWRVFIVSGKDKRIYGIIALLSCLHYGLHLATEARTLELAKVALFIKTQWIAISALACGAAADTLIAGSLSCYLYKSRTGVKRTDSVIKTLLLYTINTGILTSTFALTAMICYLTMPNNLIHVSFNIIVGELYTNTLLATLMIRKGLRAKIRRDRISLTTLSTRTGDAAPIARSATEGRKTRDQRPCHLETGSVFVHPNFVNLEPSGPTPSVKGSSAAET